MFDSSASTPDRSFARVDLALPIRLRVLEESETYDLARRFMAEPSRAEHLTLGPFGVAGEEPSWEQQALASIVGRIDRLESSLDRIARALGVELGDGFEWIDGDAVSLSGSGLGVHIPRSLPENTPVEVHLTLLGNPTTVLRTLGRIACQVAPDGDAVPVGRYHLGIAFSAIHAEDQAEVIRYTFRVQREELRRRRDSLADSREAVEADQE